MFAGGNLAFLWRPVLERDAPNGGLCLGGMEKLEPFVPLRRKKLSVQLAMVWGEIY